MCSPELADFLALKVSSACTVKLSFVDLCLRIGLSTVLSRIVAVMSYAVEIAVVSSRLNWLILLLWSKVTESQLASTSSSLQSSGSLLGN